MIRSIQLQTLLLAPLFLPMAGCGGGHDHPHPHPDDAGAHAHPDEGPHGGRLLEVGDHVAHLELLHDAGNGRLELHVLEGDGTTPLAAGAPPELKLLTDDGPLVVPCTPLADGLGEGCSFAAEHPELQHADLHGRVAVELGGRTYQPEL